MKSSASIYKSSGSQFFSITIEIQSRPGVFDELRSVMTFSVKLVVTGIFYSFRLILERKAGEEMSKSSRLELLEKFSSNRFGLSDAGGNASGPL